MIADMPTNINTAQSFGQEIDIKASFIHLKLFIYKEKVLKERHEVQKHKKMRSQSSFDENAPTLLSLLPGRGHRRSSFGTICLRRAL